MWRAAHGSDMDGGSLAKSRLHAGSVPMLSAGWCEGGILRPTGGSMQGDQAEFCNALS